MAVFDEFPHKSKFFSVIRQGIHATMQEDRI